jgi:hypothetical protein
MDKATASASLKQPYSATTRIWAGAFWLGVLSGVAAVCSALIAFQIVAVGPFQPFRLIVVQPGYLQDPGTPPNQLRKHELGQRAGLSSGLCSSVERKKSSDTEAYR